MSGGLATGAAGAGWVLWVASMTGTGCGFCGVGCWRTGCGLTTGRGLASGGFSWAGWIRSTISGISMICGATVLAAMTIRMTPMWAPMTMPNRPPRRAVVGRERA